VQIVTPPPRKAALLGHCNCRFKAKTKRFCSARHPAAARICCVRTDSTAVAVATGRTSVSSAAPPSRPTGPKLPHDHALALPRPSTLGTLNWRWPGQRGLGRSQNCETTNKTKRFRPSITQDCYPQIEVAAARSFRAVHFRARRGGATRLESPLHSRKKNRTRRCSSSVARCAKKLESRKIFA